MNRVTRFCNAIDHCVICLEKIEITEWLCENSCKHKFHDDCIQRWLTDYSKYKSCPLCRALWIKSTKFKGCWETPIFVFFPDIFSSAFAKQLVLSTCIYDSCMIFFYKIYEIANSSKNLALWNFTFMLFFFKCAGKCGIC